jgi:hypothetical protein
MGAEYCMQSKPYVGLILQKDKQETND